MTKRYVITYAQDRTPVHKGFWSALQNCARARKAELIVVAGVYKNPTNPHDSDFEDAEDEGAYSTEVQPHLAWDRRVLAPNLTLFADVRVQPTAVRPLTGFEVFTAGHSGIFAHPKRAMEVVPTATRMPRVLWTTGACTEANYSHSKAGKKGEEHHVLGALIVEIDAKGIYFIRNVTYDRSTLSFTDLGTRYNNTHAKIGAKPTEPAPPAAALTLGDVHVGQDSKGLRAEKAAQKLFELIRPRHLVLHDVLDFRTRNHHDRGFRAQYAGRAKRVLDEVLQACKAVQAFAEWGDATHETHIVRSNHDEALERWVEEFKPREDAENAAYWHYLQWRALRHFEKRGAFPDLFSLEYERFSPTVPVHFLKRNEPLRIANVEGGFHGDKGPNGSRGSRNGYVKMGCKVNRGHGHVPGICDGVFDTGVYGSLDHGYNGLPSAWMNAHVVTLADGKRQLVIVIDGRFST